ncbi:hypothetical protein SEEH4541_07240 [Salmonella enterica subsp. enterica serovar Heidelberg str. N4541]|nr:hypothetical protein SEEH4541_07240 [Salmonella enterica subsp. enterica serovar Heidelberg str. N4541]
MRLFLGNSWRACTNGATNLNSASILITRSLPRRSRIPGNAVGRLFFAEQRIGWQLELAAEKGITFGNIDAIVEHVQQRLASHQPQPSLLHGDLWSANCALGPDGPYIFDPACYWGDRECDLAMLPLHTDQPPQIYDGYQSVSPLPLDFLDRQPIYQLYTLLNRARLFGGQHLATAQKAMDRLLAV